MHDKAVTLPCACGGRDVYLCRCFVTGAGLRDRGGAWARSRAGSTVYGAEGACLQVALEYRVVRPLNSSHAPFLQQ